MQRSKWAEAVKNNFLWCCAVCFHLDITVVWPLVHWISSNLMWSGTRDRGALLRVRLPLHFSYIVRFVSSFFVHLFIFTCVCLCVCVWLYSLIQITQWCCFWLSLSLWVDKWCDSKAVTCSLLVVLHWFSVVCTCSLITVVHLDVVLGHYGKPKPNPKLLNMRNEQQSLYWWKFELSDHSYIKTIII